jgi:hypothetical protein
MVGVNGQKIPRDADKGASMALFSKSKNSASGPSGTSSRTRQSVLSLRPDHLALVLAILLSDEIPAPNSLPRVLLNIPPPTFFITVPIVAIKWLLSFVKFRIL